MDRIATVFASLVMLYVEIKIGGAFLESASKLMAGNLLGNLFILVLEVLGLLAIPATIYFILKSAFTD